MRKGSRLIEFLVRGGSILALFTLSQVEYEVQDLSGGRQKILAGIDLSIEEGELFTIIGPSGAGKSTLLFLLNRLHEASAGLISYEGRPLYDYKVTELRRQIGMLLQKPYMLPGSVEANLLAGPQLQGENSAHTPEELIKLVGLGPGILPQEARSLSGGEQQRVSLARLLANQPRVLLLDEPTAALNQAAAEEIEALIKNLVINESLTVIMVTHDLEQARRLGTVTALISGGRVVECSPTATFFSQPEQGLTAKYLEENRQRGGKGAWKQPMI